MCFQNNKNRSSRAMTLVEITIALAIMAIIFAALVPQIRLIQNSWDSKVGASETLQNGRILIDHLNRNLSKVSRITAVSDLSQINGYIEFIDNDANNVRYDVNSISNYVEFGLIGNPSDLAGPVSQLQFTCYDSNDFSTPITDVNSIRFVKVQTTVTNSAMLGQDMNFSTQAYIRTNTLPAPWGDTITKLSEPWFEYDTTGGMESALCQIDATHYLCAYAGPLGHGWAVVLTVDTVNWTISAETPFEYDTIQGNTPALCQIDNTHYLCAYHGDGEVGRVVVLTVDTGTWNVSKEVVFEYDVLGIEPALAKINQTYYLCAYHGAGDDGWACILNVNTGNWTITKEDSFEFDTDTGLAPALVQIDQTHYLCAYTGKGIDGFATVLTVDTGNWTITNNTPLEYDTTNGEMPELVKIDGTHYLCAYSGQTNNGHSVILKVDTGTWAVTKETWFEFDNGTCNFPDLMQIDGTHYFCAYQGSWSDGFATILTVDTGTWTITALEKADALEFDIENGQTPAIAKIDDSHYLCAYTGLLDYGYAGVFEVSKEIRP